MDNIHQSEKQNFQPNYIQQPQYSNVQYDYSQQVQYQNFQNDYAQQYQYQNVQNDYVQQYQYQNVQQGYVQNQVNYNTPQIPAKIKKPTNKKVIVILCVMAVVAVIAIIFLPKLFKSKDPFYGIKPGTEAEKFLKKYDLTEEQLRHRVDWEGFGETGCMHVTIYDGELVKLSWILYDRDCGSRERYYEVLEEVEEYYTDEYGTPENVERKGSADKLCWKTGVNSQITLSVNGNDFSLRYEKIRDY